MSAVAVRLVTPDLALLDAAIAVPQALGGVFGCAVAEGWDVFPEALRPTRDAVAADPRARVGAHACSSQKSRGCWSAGGDFKGPPREGAVEIGYAVAPSWEGHGIAAAAVRELVREAFGAPHVETVLAHTLAEPGPSMRVLEKAGFVRGAQRRGREGLAIPPRPRACDTSRMIEATGGPGGSRIQRSRGCCRGRQPWAQRPVEPLRRSAICERGRLDRLALARTIPKSWFRVGF